MSIVKKLGKDIPWHLRKLLVGHSNPWNQTFLLLLQEWLHLQSHILYISISSWIVRHQPVLDSSRIKIIMNMWIDLAVKNKENLIQNLLCSVLVLAHSPEDLARFHLRKDHQQHGLQLGSLLFLETRRILFHEQKYENQHSNIVPVREPFF